MTQNVEVHTADVIERALRAPLDWEMLEGLAHAVLVADDLPTLRKLGGIGDQGIDAVEEAFYDAERQVRTVVQVTSAHGHRSKVRDTLAKLRKHNIDVNRLVFVTRHPVGSSTRVEMIDEADQYDIALDVRDQSYLVSILGKHSTIFLRFFGSTSSQITALLGQADPLNTASNRMQRALLATLGAYVLSDHARLARGYLFDKTVLAALAAEEGGRATKRGLLETVGRLVPNEEHPSLQQIDAAVARLSRTGDCSVDGDTVVCGESTLKRCLNAASSATVGFDRLLDHIVTSCKKAEKLNDAHLGYIERNLRRAIVQLLRVTGPLDSNDDQGLDFGPDASDEVQGILALDLPPDVGRAALLAFASFVQDRTRAVSLAPLVRAYAALAIRNIDPMGRRWQQAVLARSIVALDTDALLYLIVEELPEHSAVLNALTSMQQAGVDVVVPDHVFAEAVGHLGRAPRTYRRFADRLLRLPEATVNSRVWHAVVRGYYYAKRAGYAGTFEKYYEKYYIENRSSELAEHILSMRMKLRKMCLDQPPAESEACLHELETAVMEFRERFRRKATFRDPVEMSVRVRADVAMALTLSARNSDQIGAPARGYVASSDRTFRWIEGNDLWNPRKAVHIWTAALPELSCFAFGSTRSPAEAVEILFNPVTIAAAELMDQQINILTAIGIDLKEVPLERLDWDLKNSLTEKLNALGQVIGEAETADDSASALATLDVARAAIDAGYNAVPQVQTLAEEFDVTKSTLLAERQKRQQVEEQLRRLVQAAREQSTSKPLRRFNKLLSDLGIEIEDLDESEVDGGD